MTQASPDAAAVRTLLEPSSVTIIGASADPTRIGGRPVANLMRAGFSGQIYPVNPKYEEIQGLKVYASVAALPETPDLAIIAVPLRFVFDTIDACGARGVPTAILFSAGFAEVGGEGVQHQKELVARARANNIRLLGPNCLGAMNAHAGLYATFSTSLASGFPQPGNIGFVTQSGAFGSHCFTMARERGMGVSCLITTGNEADIDTSDCLAYFAEDPNTQVIALHLEGCKDGDKLKTALDMVRRAGKPVITIKGGTSELGAAATLSHTASLSGADEAYDALFRRYGVYRAHSIAEYIGVAQAAGHGILPRGNRLGIITISGGVGVFMADAAQEHGLNVAALPDKAQALLKEKWPPAAVRNPVDTTAQPVSDPEMTAQFQDVMLQHGDYDVLINFMTVVALSPDVIRPFRPSLRALRERYPDRLLIISAVCSPEVRQWFEEDGFVVIEDPHAAVEIAAALVSMGQSLAQPVMSAATEESSPAKTVLPSGPLDEHSALELLGQAGVPVVPTERVDNADDAAKAAAAVGFPAVLKIASPDIQHKSDMGGVRLNLTDPDAVRTAFDEVMTAAAEHHPLAHIQGAVIAPMRSATVEVALGMNNDPTFGPLIMVGIGGVFIEIMRDVAFELAPFDKTTALAMLRRLKGYALLEGARGRPRADIDAVADALVQLSRFALQHADDLESIDINPLLVFPEGQGVAAADAVFIRKSDS